MALLAAFLLLIAQTPSSTSSKIICPEVLLGLGSAMLIVLDDVAAADLAVYGGPVQTPHLAALAAQGVRFDQAIANPVCQPSRRSLLYGHWWTTNTGNVCGGGPSSQDVTLDDWCLPRLMPAAKAVLLGKWHIAVEGGAWKTAPVDHGFDHWQSGMTGNLPGCGGADYFYWFRINDGTSNVTGVYEPYDIRDRTRFWWNTLPGTKLFVVSLALPHAPLHAPPPELLPPGYVVAGYNRAKFEAMVIAADTIVGQILEDVDLSTTLVVVVGDNGTPPNATPERGKSKTTTFERGIRVPLIMAGAGVCCPGRSSQELVHLVDIYATLAERCGGALPTNPLHPVAGVSLMPTLQETAPHVYHEYVLAGTLWPSASGDRCARSLQWKLRQLDFNGDGASDQEALYNLVSDPGETVNVIGQNPAQADAMRAWLEANAP